MIIYKDKIIRNVYGFSIDNTGLEPEEMCDWLGTSTEAHRKYYAIPYMGDYGPIAFRDSMDQLRWAERYLSDTVLDYIIELEDRSFIPLTREMEDEIHD